MTSVLPGLSDRFGEYNVITWHTFNVKDTWDFWNFYLSYNIIIFSSISKLQ